MGNAYSLSKDEISNVRYKEYENGFECTIEVAGQDYTDKGETKDKAYIKAVLIAEFILLPPMPDTVVC